MKRNKNKLIGTKYSQTYIKGRNSIFFLICFALPVLLNAQTPQIWPAEISFNYEGGSTNDAIAIKNNASSTISAPEYIKDSKNESCAYIKSQGNRKIKVKFNSNNSNMNFLVKATVITGTGLGSICEMFVAPCDLNTTVFTIDVQGTIPSSVGKNTFTWKWEATALPISSPYCPITCTSVNTTHTFYTLLSTPQAPLNTPWSEVLDYSCVWASGQTSNTGVMQKIVEGLYNNTGFLYDINSGTPRYTSYSTQSFNLTSMLSEIGGSQIIVNCYDMGKAVKIFANILGCNSNYAYTNPFGYLNCIKAIGRGWANNPFYASMGTDPIMGEDDDYYDGRSGFGNHAFCMFGSSIYDACLKVDTDGNPDAAPHTESWAMGWDWNTYKSKVIDNNPATSSGTPYTGYTFSVY
jgi:hypothetical protein